MLCAMVTETLHTGTVPKALTHGSVSSSRAVLLLVVAAGAAGIVLTQDMSLGYRKDAELATLIRTMGALKLASIFPLVLGAAWLRMDAPVFRRFVYGGLAAASAVGISFILTLSHVALGSLLFHLGFLGMIVHVARDPGFVAKLKPLAAFWSK